MNIVRESFLHWLHYQRNHERLNNYRIYDGYYNGDHKIDIPPKVKSALESELGTVNNYCRVVVDVPVDHICSGEVGIQVLTDESNQDKAAEAEAFLYSVYEANQLLYEEMLKIVTLMGKKGDVFLKLYMENDQIKIRVLRPDICFPRYRSDDYSDMLYCAIKWFDEEEDRNHERMRRKWKAQVFRPDVVEYYELGENTETEHSQWKLVDVQDNILGFIPVIHIKNTIDDLEFGVSDLQVMIDLQDALNKITTDMLLTMDNQAFQRMFIFGGQTPSGHKLSMEPGIITEVPNENGRLEVVPGAEIEPFIQAMREIVDQICTVTGIPRMAFSRSTGTTASGYALRLHYVPLERKCGKKKVILKNRLANLNKMIFAAAKLLGMGDYTEFGTKMQFTGGLPVDEEAQMQIHEMELKNKVKSRYTVMQERGIENIDSEMHRIKKESLSRNL